jgi:hypothetical protein
MRSQATRAAHILLRPATTSWFLLALACLPRERELQKSKPTPPPSSHPAPTSTPRLGPASNAPGAAESNIDPELKAPFSDEFERAELGAHWHATGPGWRLEGGRLCVAGAHNHPIWLKQRLPTNARIEFEAVSYSPDGDLKAEFWGDGSSAATQASYTNATSYLTIFGGWRNHFHVLARIDEHAANRPQLEIDPASTDLRHQAVVQGRSYRFRVERADSKTVVWWIDGTEILRYNDELPLMGAGHQHFGFNNWEVRTCFDKLQVIPLGG